MGRFAPPSKKVQVDVRLDEVVFRALEKEPGAAVSACQRGEDRGGVARHGDRASRDTVRHEPGSGRRPSRRGHRAAAGSLAADPPHLRHLYRHPWRIFRRDSRAVGPTASFSVLGGSTIVLAVGAGLWGVWRYVRGERAEDFTRPKDHEGHRIAPLEEWQPWPLLALVVGLYGASLFATTVSISWDSVHYGPASVFGDLGSSPNWLMSFCVSFGSWAVMTRRWFAASITGLIATGSALCVQLVAGRHGTSLRLRPLDLPGYQMSLASVALLAGGGFYGWWRSRRGARAGDAKTTLPEVGPPKSDPTRDFDGS